MDKLYRRYKAVTLRGVPDMAAAECVALHRRLLDTGPSSDALPTALPSPGATLFVDCRGDDERAVSIIQGAVPSTELLARLDAASAAVTCSSGRMAVTTCVQCALVVVTWSRDIT